MELKPMRRSKTLQAAGYEPRTRTLRLQFRHGGLYDYLDVPEEVFDSLTTSAHPWTEWQAHIKSAYVYRRLD
ncbi:KTSC domain-containing protein [Nocardioides sp. AE5]|uniref:KTSC domain-containing protein n=1 Tax=Nocardioides sp. AE5 TaxID=2962573 RepID=UPI002880BE23|nr:KTSC domain-containing protein [Nocardioides sp. AE5]MDT0202473.1 KTSC domain-containing protein [Nocardioides sp. AE5]